MPARAPESAGTVVVRSRVDGPDQGKRPAVNRSPVYQNPVKERADAADPPDLPESLAVRSSERKQLFHQTG
ncbi:hypothetical protein GCM10010387_31840 [Streptomyces inusitatus]|uniref:Uncharacterized protein n=1 Tax=Streptomyces inusitatus TaxID=68221 RepID=A0A918UVC1_9ACTN|nr:hypothetical protein GCM10010387_31840 [Streptomyces inusitatus]